MQEAELRAHMTRAEWIAVAAIGLNVVTIVFGGGAFWQTVQDHERRITSEEIKSEALIPRIERIDANVAMLVEERRDERLRGRK
jgi:hypothetical protein